MKFGIKAGLNISNPSITGNMVGDNSTTRSGINVGALANIPFSESLQLQPELVFSEQGGNLSNISGSVPVDYINVPILIKYHHSSGIFVETGPQIGFLISAKYKTDSISLNTKSDYKSSDFGWIFGLGYKIPTVNLGIDIRYNLGITNISSSELFVIKNSVFQFGVFYLFLNSPAVVSEGKNVLSGRVSAANKLNSFLKVVDQILIFYVICRSVRCKIR